MDAQDEDQALSHECQSNLCPKCKDPVKPGSVICINCGHNLRLGVNVKTIAKVIHPVQHPFRPYPLKPLTP